MLVAVRGDLLTHETCHRFYGLDEMDEVDKIIAVAKEGAVDDATLSALAEMVSRNNGRLFNVEGAIVAKLDRDAKQREEDERRLGSEKTSLESRI